MFLWGWQIWYGWKTHEIRILEWSDKSLHKGHKNVTLLQHAKASHFSVEKWKCCYYFCKRLLRTSCWGWYSVEASVISTNALHSCLPRMVAIKKSHNKSYCFFILWNEATDDLRLTSNLKSKSSMLNLLLWVVLKWGCKHTQKDARLDYILK